MVAATARRCAAWNTVTSTRRTSTSAKAATHMSAPSTIRRWKMVAASFMSLRRLFDVGVAQRRLGERAVLAVARQLLERRELHRRGVVEAELAVCQGRDAVRRGEAGPIGLQPAPRAVLVGDGVLRLADLDAGEPRLLGDIVERQDGKPHQRD